MSQVLEQRNLPLLLAWDSLSSHCSLRHSLFLPMQAPWYAQVTIVSRRAWLRSKTPTLASYRPRIKARLSAARLVLWIYLLTSAYPMLRDASIVAQLHANLKG